MKLKGRLKLIADKVLPCNTVSDIGTDHAYIPIYLVAKKVCTKAIAADVRPGPILAAKENVCAYNMEEYIETRLGDGLEPIIEDELDVVVLAGMGGMLITEIMARSLNKAKSANYLVLQPMNGIDQVREWLFENGFEIMDEELINEGEKIYNVITTRWTGFISKPDKIFLEIGEKLVLKKDPLLRKYINKKLLQINSVIDSLENSEHKDSSTISGYRETRAGLFKILNEL